MSPGTYLVRRATVDDLANLSALWRSMRFPVGELEKRLTEFQVAESQEGRLVGALGLQVAGPQGRVHSEAFSDFSVADEVRPLLWERVQSVAANHGLMRLWTQEEAPFWKRCGLRAATPDVLQKLPPAWQGSAGDWLNVQLKEETVAPLSAEKEFAMFMEAEKQRTEKAFRQARTIKHVATLLSVGLAIFVLAVVIAWLKRNPPAPTP
jgi:N-acetylglutamate synthase-like GNAT family acetyltransferase